MTHGDIGREVGVHQTTINRIARGCLLDPRASVALGLIELAGGSVQLPELPQPDADEAMPAADADADVALPAAGAMPPEAQACPPPA
ncbi:MAG: hypothetical protein ACOZD0_04495 [Pseudomonadota bacterium]